jgi:hypothetical protein
MTKRIYADLADLPEEKRINAIGNAAEKGQRVVFFVDDDPKADRYIAKLTAQFRVKVVERGRTGIGETIFVKVVAA